jgi:hypothetical protein
MQLVKRLMFTALIALCWSGVAAANPNDSPLPVDPSAVRAVESVHLDVAFESFVAEGTRNVLTGLAGPSSMECSGSGMHGGIETCLVTTERLAGTMPAALAHRLTASCWKSLTGAPTRPWRRAALPGPRLFLRVACGRGDIP